MAEEQTVQLVSHEGESFDVALSVAKMSELVNSMLDTENTDESQEIPLPNVKSANLISVIDFMQHYKVEPMKEIEKVERFQFHSLYIYTILNNMLLCVDTLFMISYYLLSFLFYSLLSLVTWLNMFKNGTPILSMLIRKNYSN